MFILIVIQHDRRRLVHFNVTALPTAEWTARQIVEAFPFDTAHVIVLDEEGLRRVLSSYFSYYHRSRLHLSLHKDSPDPRPVQSVGKIVAIPEVGGLHHRYERP